MRFELYDANGAAGTGYSEISANGGLSLTAGANTFTFNLVSVDASGNSAAALNFNPANPYSWMFAASSSAITGFNANEFNLITTGFSNSTAGGSFSFTESGNDLVLNFTPVPEPSTWALLGSGLLAVALLGLRRRPLRAPQSAPTSRRLPPRRRRSRLARRRRTATESGCVGGECT